MELSGDKPAVCGIFHDLDKSAVRRQAGKAQSLFAKLLTEIVVQFVSVAVALVNSLLAVELIGLALLIKGAGVLAEAHRAALGGDALLLGHKVDDGVQRAARKLGRVCVRPADDIAGKFDDRYLHTQTDAQIRNILFSCVAGGKYHALDAAVAEAAGDENAFAVAQYIIYILLCQLLGVDPFNIAHGIVCRSGMEKRFRDGQISVMKLNVFADERYADMALCRLYAAHHRSPLGKIGLHIAETELAADAVGKTLPL